MGLVISIQNNFYKKGKPMALMDITKVKEEAEKEVREEVLKEAKEEVKEKLKEIADAELVVRNLKRELDDLFARLSE